MSSCNYRSTPCKENIIGAVNLYRNPQKYVIALKPKLQPKRPLFSIFGVQVVTTLTWFIAVNFGAESSGMVRDLIIGHSRRHWMPQADLLAWSCLKHDAQVAVSPPHTFLQDLPQHSDPEPWPHSACTKSR